MTPFGFDVAACHRCRWVRARARRGSLLTGNWCKNGVWSPSFRLGAELPWRSNGVVECTRSHYITGRAGMANRGFGAQSVRRSRQAQRSCTINLRVRSCVAPCPNQDGFCGVGRSRTAPTGPACAKGSWYRPRGRLIVHGVGHDHRFIRIRDGSGSDPLADLDVVDVSALGIGN